MLPDLPPQTSTKPTLEDLLDPLGVPEDELKSLSPDDIASMLSRINHELMPASNKALSDTEAQIDDLEAGLKSLKLEHENLLRVAVLLWRLEQSGGHF